MNLIYYVAAIFFYSFGGHLTHNVLCFKTKWDELDNIKKRFKRENHIVLAVLWPLYVLCVLVWFSFVRLPQILALKLENKYHALKDKEKFPLIKDNFYR